MLGDINNINPGKLPLANYFHMQVSFIASISNILRPWKTTRGAFWKALAPLMTKTEGEGSMGRFF